MSTILPLVAMAMPARLVMFALVEFVSLAPLHSTAMTASPARMILATLCQDVSAPTIITTLAVITRFAPPMIVV